MIETEKKSDWPLLRVIDDAMKPSGRYTKDRIRQCRLAVRGYEIFRGGQQLACEVTPRLLDKFKEWLVTEGRKEKCSVTYASNVASVVRQADPELIPNRRFGAFSKPEEGDLLYIMENEYFASKSKIASENTEKQYKYMSTRYSRFLGRKATLDDLTDVSVGKWMRAMRKDGLAMATINGYVTHLRAFWTWCAKRRMVEFFPTIEDFPEPMRIPDAYPEADVHKLIAASPLMEGEIFGVRAAIWWEALHRVALDTGERTSAMLDLKWQHYDQGDATLEAPADIRKGGRKPMLYRLKPKTVALLSELRGTGQKRIFAWPWTIGTYYRHNRRLVKLAGIEYVPRKCGLQKLRRTFASHIEANGGNATAALAHTARRVTEKSYLDPRIVKEPAHNEKMFDV